MAACAKNLTVFCASYFCLSHLPRLFPSAQSDKTRVRHVGLGDGGAGGRQRDWSPLLARRRQDGLPERGPFETDGLRLRRLTDSIDPLRENRGPFETIRRPEGALTDSNSPHGWLEELGGGTRNLCRLSRQRSTRHAARPNRSP